METKLVEDKSVSLWVLFAVFAVVTCALFLVPAFIIQPFRYQSARGLMFALRVKKWAPLGTAVGFIICLVLFLRLWPTVRRWGQGVVGVTLLLVAVCAAMSRINYFEWMFHPVRQAGFEPASQTKLDAGEMVLALTFGGDARAYPVREMAYHHIVNDVVGDVPVAVTY